jgi:peptidoglycan-associated lipoprotein
MRKTLWISLALLFVLPGLLFTASCAKKPLMSGAVMTQPSGDEAADAGQAAMTTDEQRRIMAARNEFLYEDVYFGFDRYDLRPAAQTVLRKKAQWLHNNSDISVYIEGHCDERGTAEYNLALGDRRAESAKSFLIDLGIAPSRLTTISYGEEQPVDAGHNEEAWAKNRRAHFVID